MDVHGARLVVDAREIWRCLPLSNWQVDLQLPQDLVFMPITNVDRLSGADAFRIVRQAYRRMARAQENLTTRKKQ